MTEPTRTGRVVNASTLWAGGAAAALVSALIAVVGILICRGILGIPVLAPEGEGAWGDADTMTYALAAALAALVATGLMHILLLLTPRPTMFFNWVMTLITLVAVLAPFAVTAARNSQIATAMVNLVLGVAIGTLVSGSARGAVRRVAVAGDPRSARPPMPPYQPS